MSMNNISTTTLDPTVARLYTARAAIQQFGQPILFTIGMIGCILNIAIFLRPSMRSNSCAIYFHANSWANLFCLTWGVLASFLAFYTNNNPASYNRVYCKIRFYMIAFSQWSSRAFVLLACLDRYLICSTSVHQRRLCRVGVARKVVPLTAFICACLPIYVLVTYEPYQRLIPCMATTKSLENYDLVWSWIFTFGTPTVLMSTLSGMTLRRLKQNAKRMGREKIHVGGKDMQLAGMLIGQVLLYIMTNLPYVCYTLYATLTQYIPTSSKSPQRVAREAFAQTFLTSFFFYFFNGMSFFVYTLTAPSFRRELLEMILPRRWLRRIQINKERHIAFIANRINPLQLNRTSIELLMIKRRSTTVGH